MSEMPDFESTTLPVNEYPAPKKPRRKPTKRKAVKKSLYSKLTEIPKRVVKKRKVAKRRGRPAGSTNKPKAPKTAVVEGYTSEVATVLSVHAQIETALSRLSLAERRAMLEHLR